MKIMDPKIGIVIATYGKKKNSYASKSEKSVSRYFK
jgi:hypothetical protein